MRNLMVVMLITAGFIISQYAICKEPGNTTEHYCFIYSAAFGYAAMLRDKGKPPTIAYRNIRVDPTLKSRTIKNIVNSIYYNKKFAKASGDPLVSKMYKYCMNHN